MRTYIYITYIFNGINALYELFPLPTEEHLTVDTPQLSYLPDNISVHILENKSTNISKGFEVASSITSDKEISDHLVSPMLTNKVFFATTHNWKTEYCHLRHHI